jgi:hypothetical protein
MKDKIWPIAAILLFSMQAFGSQDSYCMPTWSISSYGSCKDGLELKIENGLQEMVGKTFKSFTIKFHDSSTIIPYEVLKDHAFKIESIPRVYYSDANIGLRTLLWTIESQLIGLQKEGKWITVQNGRWSIAIYKDGSIEINIVYTLNDKAYSDKKIIRSPANEPPNSQS